MPAKPRTFVADGIYHVTVRTNNREWFSLPTEVVWEIFERYIFYLRMVYRVETLAFVLMNNHFHWLIQTREPNLGRAMGYMMRECSRRLGELTGRINHIFSRRYHASLIEDQRHLAAVYKYLYRNPVAAGLSEKVEEYPFSTLQILLGQKHSVITVLDPLEFTSSPEEHLDWMNFSYDKKAREQLRKALRRPVFDIKADPKSKKLDRDLILWL